MSQNAKCPTFGRISHFHILIAKDHNVAEAESMRSVAFPFLSVPKTARWLVQSLSCKGDGCSLLDRALTGMLAFICRKLTVGVEVSSYSLST